MSITILLLAAGSSSRMGQSKQLLPVNGVPLLVRSVREALNACPDVTVVLGAQAEAHRSALAGIPLNIVVNPHWQKGMGNSLKQGLAHLLQIDPLVEGVLVMVCDQPGATSSHLVKLIKLATQSTKTIIASAYGNTQGVPALFKRQAFELLALIGDESGASKLIRQHPEMVDVIDLPGGDIDIDTPTDYQRFLNPPQNRR